MCGRYALHAQPEVIALQFGLAEAPKGLRARYNIAPSQEVPVVRCRPGGERELVPMRWGLVPHWSKEPKTGFSTINARAETVDAKPAYRTAFRRRRCLVPASGWYEWQATPRGKQPCYFRPRTGELLAFAGLWERWGEGEEAFDSYTIIVTDANDLARTVHNRMPVVLGPDAYAVWLEPAITDAYKLKPLLVPCPDEWLEAYAVSTGVNSPRNDEAALIDRCKHRD